MEIQSIHLHQNMKINICARSANRLICIFTKFSLLASLFLFTPSAYSAGEFMVAPTRIVFENRDRSARVNLINTSTETSTYRIQFENKRMTEAGQVLTVEEPLPGELFADKMVRYSPRQITLPPGKSQTIRVILRKPSGLAEGEYRSHLAFSYIPTNTSSDIENTIDPASGQIAIRLIPILKITIPVIVRQGKLSAQAAMNNIEYHAEEIPYLELTLKRTGNQSIYGDLTATFTDKKGEQFVVGKANGVAVYTPNQLRKYKLSLQPTPGLDIKNGKLTISYHEKEKAGGKLLTESTISIP